MSSPTQVVSIVVPMLNEATSILDCLGGFADQTAPAGSFEVLVVDGGSEDASRELVDEFALDHPWVRRLDNPERRIPIACNIGLHAAHGDIVCFFSAHGVPDPTFVDSVRSVLAETGATGVGGRYRHEGVTPQSLAIGVAMASPFGMASPHRFASERREVDTISHPAYLIEAVRAAGGFDESMQRNEDYELNWRIRSNGGRLVFDPSIGSVYRPRGSLRHLARQFFWYGAFKAKMLKSHPRSMRARHIVPPLAVVGAGVGLPLLTVPAARRPIAALAAAYVGVVAVGFVSAARDHPGADPRVLAVAFPTMHVSWGSGFLAGLAGWEGS